MCVEYIIVPNRESVNMKLCMCSNEMMIYLSDQLNSLQFSVVACLILGLILVFVVCCVVVAWMIDFVIVWTGFVGLVVVLKMIALVVLVSLWIVFSFVRVALSVVQTLVSGGERERYHSTVTMMRLIRNSIKPKFKSNQSKTNNDKPSTPICVVSFALSISSFLEFSAIPLLFL